MIVEVIFDEQNTPSPQRRPNGHVKSGATKKGNKKRGLRGRLVSLLDEEEGSEEADDEEDLPLDGGGPPVLSCLPIVRRGVEKSSDTARVKLGGRC